MATIKKSVIGSITGKSDNIVFKNRNGKNVAYVWPKNYKASKSAFAKEGRSNFAITVKFAKAVNSVPELKEIWALADVEGSNSFQKIIKNNARLARIKFTGLPLPQYKFKG